MPKDPPKKSKGVFASDEQRANMRHEWPAPAREMSGEIEVPERRSPEYDEEITPRPTSIRVAVDKLWAETREDVKKLDKRVDEHALRLVAISGEEGDNGKVGVIKGRVDALYSKLWWILTVAIGGMVGAAVKLIIVVRAFDAVESRSEHNTQKIELLQSQALQLQAQVQTLQAALIARHRNDVDQPDRMTP